MWKNWKHCIPFSGNKCFRHLSIDKFSKLLSQHQKLESLKNNISKLQQNVFPCFPYLYVVFEMRPLVCYSWKKSSSIYRDGLNKDAEVRGSYVPGQPGLCTKMP